MRFVAVMMTALVALSACGGDDGETGSDGATTTGVDIDASDATTAETVPTAETTAAPASPTTPSDPTTTSTTLVAGGETVDGTRDPCLVGSWVMKQDSLDLMAATAVPFAGIQIPSGGMTLTFGDDGTVATDAKFTAVFTMADTPAEADVFWAHSGTWTTDDDVVLMEFTSQEAGITEVRQGGVALPGPPLDPVAPINGGPYECGPNQLIISATNGSIEVPMNFER